MRLLHRDRRRPTTEAQQNEAHEIERDPTQVRRTDDTNGHRGAAAPPSSSAGTGTHPTHDEHDRTKVHEAPDIPAPHTVRERTWTFSASQIVSFVAGVGLVALGLVALIRAGVDGDLTTPTVRVLTYTHTAWLGVVEVAVGTVLILAGMGARGRYVSIVVGAALVVAGVLVRAEPDGMPDALGLEPSFGWALIVLGLVVALAAMALPVWRRRELLDRDVVNLRDDRFDNGRVPF